MKAIRYHTKGGPEVLVYEEIPDPVAGPGQVLIRVLAAGINYADTARRSGAHYPRPTPLPFVPGGEVVGVVETLGAGVTGVATGETVIGWIPQGGYAEKAVADAAGLLRVPAGVAPEQALALIVQGLSAALILKQSARLRPGDSVFIEGAAGGVGVLAVQLARIYGAGRVIGAASSAAKRALVRDLGADAAIDYTQADWPARLREANGGKPVDIILEMTGGAVFDQALTCLAPFGRMVVFGSASRQPMQLNVQSILAPNQSVTGFFLGGYVAAQSDGSKFIDGLLAEFGGYVRDGRLRLHIGGTYKLADAAAAHRAMEGRQTSGKLVLVP
jgi:NADPH2:quinone reductase